MTSVLEFLVMTGVLFAFGLITYGCYLHEVSKEEERKNERD